MKKSDILRRVLSTDYEFLCRLVHYPNLKSLKISNVLVRMRLGGVSTAGLKSTILLNKSFYGYT